MRLSTTHRGRSRSTTPFGASSPLRWRLGPVRRAGWVSGSASPSSPESATLCSYFTTLGQDLWTGSRPLTTFLQTRRVGSTSWHGYWKSVSRDVTTERTDSATKGHVHGEQETQPKGTPAGVLLGLASWLLLDAGIAVTRRRPARRRCGARSASPYDARTVRRAPSSRRRARTPNGTVWRSGSLRRSVTGSR